MVNGISFEIDSCLLKDLFDEVYSQKGSDPSLEDYSGLRIMIVNKKTHDEMFITTDKVVLSLSKKNKYNVDMRFVDELLKELLEFINKNKLGTS